MSLILIYINLINLVNVNPEWVMNLHSYICPFSYHGVGSNYMVNILMALRFNIIDCKNIYMQDGIYIYDIYLSYLRYFNYLNIWLQFIQWIIYWMTMLKWNYQLMTNSIQINHHETKLINPNSLIFYLIVLKNNFIRKKIIYFLYFINDPIKWCH